MSGSLGMSRVQLYRKIKNLFDITPVDLLRNFRLNSAMTMLRNGHITVSEAAYAVGFATPSYFSKCFKTRFGYTPAECADGDVTSDVG